MAPTEAQATVFINVLPTGEVQFAGVTGTTIVSSDGSITVVDDGEGGSNIVISVIDGGSA
jgi:hypothetical protein